MSVRPMNSSKRKALRVVASRPELPPTVEMPMTSTSGDAKASAIATASSIPGSVSIKSARVMFPLYLDVSTY